MCPQALSSNIPYLALLLLLLLLTVAPFDTCEMKSLRSLRHATEGSNQSASGLIQNASLQVHPTYGSGTLAAKKMGGVDSPAYVPPMCARYD